MKTYYLLFITLIGLCALTACESFSPNDSEPERHHTIIGGGRY